MNQAIKTALLWFLGFWLFTWSLGLEFFRAIQVGFVGIVFSMVLVIILVLSDEYAKDVFFDIDDTPLEFQNWVHLFVRKCGKNCETDRRETRGFRKHSYICYEHCSLPANSASSLVLSLDRY